MEKVFLQLVLPLQSNCASATEEMKLLRSYELPSARIRPFGSISPQTPFSIDFTLDSRADSGEISLALPFIGDNTGVEDRFAVEEPDDGQVNVAAEGLSSPISVEKLGEVLQADLDAGLNHLAMARCSTIDAASA